MSNYAKELADLRAETRRLRHEMYQRPLRPPRTRSGVYRLTIVGGNTLDDAVTDGIVYESTPIATVPSLYDPNVTSTFIDGIGRATLSIDGVAQSGYVLVVHDSDATVISDCLFAGDVCLTSPVTTTILLSGDPTQAVQAYRALTP